MRTFNEILLAHRADWVSNSILAELYGLDQELTFTEQFSTVSLESIISYIVAYAIYLHEQIVFNAIDTLTAKVAEEYYFTIPWYKSKCLAFQLGDTVAYDEETKKFSYAEITESKKIIQHVAVRERVIDEVTKLQVFVAKEGKAALEEQEMEAFKSYLKGVAAAGTHFEYISQAPDQLAINLSVTYNPQLLYNTGAAISSGEEPVKQAVVNYLNNITYSGNFSRTKLTDEVQKAMGVLDVSLGAVQLNGEINQLALFESNSGFFEIELDNINVTYQPGSTDDY